MNPGTAQALRTINRTFYRDCAQVFSTTRSRPWPGFERVLAHCGPALAVLDVGCGNGRFARALAACVAPRVRHYTGVDESAGLLEVARGLPWPFPVRFVEQDILDPGPPWGAARYSLVAVFAVLHHIPGRAQRRALVQGLGRALAADGVLALSFFRYERSPRIMSRLVAPCHSPLLPAGVALDADPGDFLMPFGHTGRLRYCHLFDDRELDELSALDGLRFLARFTGDGPEPLNDYLLLQRDDSSPYNHPRPGHPEAL